MQNASRIQLIAPLLFLCVVFAAEACAYALASHPASALLWFLNVEVFGLFRKSRMLLGDWGAVPFAQLALVAPIAGAALAGVLLQRRFIAALATNVSFLGAAFLAYSWAHWSYFGQLTQASLVPIALPTGYDLWLFAMLGIAALISITASHHLYIRAIRGADAK